MNTPLSFIYETEAGKLGLLVSPHWEWNATSCPRRLYLFEQYAPRKAVSIPPRLRVDHSKWLALSP